ncbi:GNAT family N-acetyltransferase [Paenibacillus elgii]|uniref:GNAT family N-acetyltransferase n=1 Tax=Paenibacillus elgii TaxID=189691 RepID=UPI0020423B81|nr:GNAT family N-acetyltransferase [Paenibacillus elgii]MCM3268072.1 GNAT family N-acetyltransferase [Paenibacillus elgii]
MPDETNTCQVRIEPWAEADLDLLYRLNTPEMLEHLGGPETEEQLLVRHKRYVEIGRKGTGRMFGIFLQPSLEAVGNIGYWERNWQGETVYETGWGVLPAYQGKGIAAMAATAAIASAKNERKHRYMHAFPSVDNPASNAICRKLGFQFVAECSFEYPPGSIMRCNDWRLDLDASVV